MIKVEMLTISEFRGVRQLQLQLKRKNFAVCGPNGTGKSGIVDALEFVLTGTISRLSGKGRGDLSVKDQGPHVDSQKSPEKAFVEAVVWIPELNQTVTARRTVKAPSALKLAPDRPDIRAIFRQLEAHPEIALSRREIIRYVLTEPGQRAKDVQVLLKLDELEQVRVRLQKIANAADATAKKAKTDGATAIADLVRAMNISDATDAKVLEATNKRRLIIGLPQLKTLSTTDSLREGLTTSDGGQTTRVNKAVAKADAEATSNSLQLWTDSTRATAIADARGATALLQADEAMLDAVVRDDFLKTALELYDGQFCPACDAPRSPEEFTAIIHAKRTKLETVRALREKAEAAIAPLREAFDTDYALTRSIYQVAKQLLEESDLKIVADHGTALKSASEKLRAFLPLESTLGVLDALVPFDAITEVVAKLRSAIDALPAPSEQDAAREYLITAQHRLDLLRRESDTATATRDRATKARRVFDLYKKTSDAALERVYENVQSQFAKLYRKINADDEGSFAAKLTPSLGELGFGVDFYGRGFFPPGAYHSEGHQDSMGCLYLALMRHLLGAGFTFAVLDDVLMSVDAGHRREVSKLLRSEFSDIQFVLTTHDKTWLKFMGTTNLVESSDTVHFRKWTVDEGPTVWSKGDVWDEIRALADVDDILGAAALLRRSLEHLSAEFCQALRARVEFSVDGHHDLGDLLDPATSIMKSLYKKARVAAESWQDTGRVVAIQEREKIFSEVLTAAKVEQWQINPSVHYNEWANLQRQEFVAVVNAFEAVCAQFKCDGCGTLIEVSPGRGIRQYIQCLCGKTKFSFMKKPKEKTAA